MFERESNLLTATHLPSSGLPCITMRSAHCITPGGIVDKEYDVPGAGRGTTQCREQHVSRLGCLDPDYTVT